MNGDKQLRLSLFAVPDLSIGRAPLTPQNCQFDARRVQYLDGMVAYLESVFTDLRRHHSRSDALSTLQKVLARLPYSELVQIDHDGNPVVSAIPGARDRIVFDHERLRVAILDGLNRRSESPMIPVGRDSPELAHVISKLSQGPRASSENGHRRHLTGDHGSARSQPRRRGRSVRIDRPSASVRGARGPAHLARARRAAVSDLARVDLRRSIPSTAHQVDRRRKENVLLGLLRG